MFKKKKTFFFHWCNKDHILEQLEYFNYLDLAQLHPPCNTSTAHRGPSVWEALH